MKESDAAHGVHQLVLVHGYERARQMVPEKHRLLVDIAAEVMADERQNIGISYTGFCLTSLPHKRLADEAVWQKQGHRVTLLVEPGRLKTAAGDMKLYGVPYGARARMILTLPSNPGCPVWQPSGRAWPFHAGVDGTHGSGCRRRDGAQPARTVSPHICLHPQVLLGGR